MEKRRTGLEAVAKMEFVRNTKILVYPVPGFHHTPLASNCALVLPCLQLPPPSFGEGVDDIASLHKMELLGAHLVWLIYPVPSDLENARLLIDTDRHGDSWGRTYQVLDNCDLCKGHSQICRHHPIGFRVELRWVSGVRAESHLYTPSEKTVVAFQCRSRQFLLRLLEKVK